MTDGRRDRLWAVATGLTALALYLRTLAPGLVAILDTPMFQFIGRVLGVAHNPGYPFYVFLTYPFSYLPIGSLAYRINLFSALCGSLTVALIFLVARELGCRRIVCAAAALGLACGHIFWSQSVIAEVYTLDTAIIAGMTLALLVWGRTGRPRYFYAAAALFAAGLGNHTTIVGFLPGMAAYAWLANRAFTARVRTLAATVLILCAGVLQYAFILVRSSQPGAYVESPARSIPELLAVMSGRQFGDRLFVFGWEEVVRDRVPWLIARVIVPELTVPGLLLAAVGAAWLLWRRRRDALLVGTGVVATAGFLLNYSVIDAPVFMIPGTIMLWVLAAVGGEQATRVAERAGTAGSAVAVAMCALPIWLAAQNFAVTDRSRDTAAGVTFDRLFETLPDRTAIVHEDFLVDRMVMFKLLGEEAARGRRIEPVGREAGGLLERTARGEHVFAFGRSARRLRYEGLDVSYAPVPLLGGSFGQYLDGLEKGSIVAVAVPAAYAEAFRRAWSGLAAIGVESDPTAGQKAAFAAIGVVGARGGVRVQSDPADTHMAVSAGAEVGSTGRVAREAFDLRARQHDAAIRRGGREVAWSSDGGVIAIWDSEGAFERAFAIQALDEFRVPVPASALSVYPVEGLWDYQTLRSEWTAIDTSARTGSLLFDVPAGASLTVVLASTDPLAPRVIDQSSPDVAVEAVRADEAARDVIARLPGGGSAWPGHGYRIEVRATGANAVSVLVGLGGVPDRVVARGARDASGRARVFSVDTRGLLRVRDRSTHVLLMARDEQAQLIGAGWSPVDWDAVSPFRWMIDVRAHLVLPVATATAAAVHVQAYREPGAPPETIELTLNGVDLGRQAVREGWQRYEWSIPEGLVTAGTSRVALSVDRLPPAGDGVVKAFAVSELRVVSP